MNENYETQTSNSKKITAYQLCSVSLITAVLCVVGPIAIPIGDIPVSFTNLALLLAVYVLGAKLGTISCLLYLLLGIAGLPVFSGYAGGMAKLTGPTGGYLIGFIFLTYISGLFIQKSNCNLFWSMVGMLLGMAALHIFGTGYYMHLTGCTFWQAVIVCKEPVFIFVDFIKILLAAFTGREIRKRLGQAHLLLNE